MALSNIVDLVFFSGLNTVGATLPTSVGASVNLGANGKKAGLVLVQVIDQAVPGVADPIGGFFLSQSYDKSIAQGGIIQYGIYQLPGFNYSGKTFTAIFCDASNLG